MNIFKNITKDVEQNPLFIKLKNSPGYSPARKLLLEICSLMKDKDGNFVQQFQTTGFYPRLWEIYLNLFFKEMNLKDITKHNRPDYHLKNNDIEFFIEASCSNPSHVEEYTDDYIEKSMIIKDKSVEQNLINYYTIKIGSVLYSKLKKEYWNLEWVKSKPFLIALMPSHNKMANFLPDYKVIEYLYGKWFKTSINPEYKLTSTSGKMHKHRHKKKEIPSNFFEQPKTENISAILFSNNCDLQKFNRMGQQGKYFAPNVIMVRAGSCFNHDEGAVPQTFTFDVGDQTHIENWSEGISIFHNPNAKNPLDKDIFCGVRQIWINEKGQIDGFMPKFFPFHSVTGIMYF